MTQREEELLTALLAAEWCAVDGWNDYRCPCCEGAKPNHKPGCQVGAALGRLCAEPATKMLTAKALGVSVEISL